MEKLYAKLQKLGAKRRVDQNIRHKLLTPEQLCETIYSHSPNLQVTKSQLYAAFILSKCTVELENDKPEEYTKVKFVEFLEFIGRIAYARFKSDPDKHTIWSLETKITAILQSIFVIIGEKPINPGD